MGQGLSTSGPKRPFALRGRRRDDESGPGSAKRVFAKGSTFRTRDQRGSRRRRGCELWIVAARGCELDHPRTRVSAILRSTARLDYLSSTQTKTKISHYRQPTPSLDLFAPCPAKRRRSKPVQHSCAPKSPAAHVAARASDARCRNTAREAQELLRERAPTLPPRQEAPRES